MLSVFQTWKDLMHKYVVKIFVSAGGTEVWVFYWNFDFNFDCCWWGLSIRWLMLPLFPKALLSLPPAPTEWPLPPELLAAAVIAATCTLTAGVWTVEYEVCLQETPSPLELACLSKVLQKDGAISAFKTTHENVWNWQNQIYILAARESNYLQIGKKDELGVFGEIIAVIDGCSHP